MGGLATWLAATALLGRAYPLHLQPQVRSVSTCFTFGQVLKTAALLNPEISTSIQIHHPYTGNLNSETPGDSKNTFLHCGDVLGLLSVQLSTFDADWHESAIKKELMGSSFLTQ